MLNGSHRARSLKEIVGFILFAAFVCGPVWLIHSQAAKKDLDNAESEGFSQSPKRGPKSRPTPNCGLCPPAGEQILYIPLVEFSDAQDGELVFNSRSAGPMNVTPIFYERNGEAFKVDPVQVEAGEIRYEQVKNLLPDHLRDKRDWGGFALSFSGLPREMWSQFRFPSVNGGGSVDEFFTTKAEAHSKTFEAVWWAPEKSEVILALGNLSDESTSASIVMGSGKSRTMKLAPHATEILKEKSPYEGTQSVKIDVTGAPGSVIPVGIISTKDGSFNSAIRFYDPSTAKQPSLFANGFNLHGATPHMVLKNTTSSTIAVLPTFIPLAGKTGLFSLPQVVLSPGTPTEVDLTPLISEAKRRPELNVVSVEVQNNAAPGSLIGSLYTIDETTGSNYEIPLRDSGPLRNMAGLYPWKITDDFQTVIYITNISDQPTEFVAEATYEGGSYTLSPHKLKPGETSIFDLEKIRREGILDSSGKALPQTASLGQFKWAIRGVTNGKTSVIGRALMVSRERKISSSYSCHPDCGPNYQDEIQPYSCDLEVGQSCQVTAWETAQFVDGQTIGPYAAEAEWSLTDQIATLDPAVGGETTVTATSGGETGLNGLLPWQQVYDFDGYSCLELYSYRPSVSAGINVKPTLTGIHTIWWFNDYDSPNSSYYPISTTLTASPGSASYTFEITYGSDKAGLGEFLASTYTTSNNEVLLSSRSGSQQEEDVVVKVTANGKTSEPFYVTVRRPLYLVRNTGYPVYGAAPGWPIGFETQIEFSVLDNMNETLPYDMPMNEYFTTSAITDYSGENWPQPPPNDTTTFMSTFTDHYVSAESQYGVYYPDPFAPGSSLSTTRVQHFGQQYWVGASANGTGVLVQQHTIVFFS